MVNGQTRVLHVEVGGSYGGSQRALELYLAHSDRGRFLHDVLFYFPTPLMERLKPLARSVFTLNDMASAGPWRPMPGMPDWLRTYLKGSSLATALNVLQEWASLARSLATVDRLRRIFRAGLYDVIHINNTFTYQAPTLLAARRARIKAIAHIRNPVRNNAFNRWLLRRTHSVVTINRSLELELRSWGIPVKIQTCYDAVDTPSTDSSASRALRASLVPSGAVLVGSIGRLEEQKGYRCLINAALRVTQTHPKVHFAIAGEGPLHSSLQRLIDELRLNDRFHLCGFREDAGNFLAALDLFVSPSLWEGGPLTLIEAMLLGKPVVATSVGVSSEIVAPGENGELVPPSDAQALATAILLALERTGDHGYERARTRACLEAFTDPSSSARVLDGTLDQSARHSR